ncbi:MAG: hypothetical protein IVW36_00765 [Dehalococcoidia bacterium]|nr:hypothetical protein [Dehalococcoidia bacterium]
MNNRHERALHGRVLCVTDHGTVVMVTIDTREQMWHLAADGNIWRRNVAPTLGPGDLVEFEMNGWGGLETIALFEREGDDD